MNQYSPSSLSTDVVNRTYAGVLGKLIGVYLGRAVEGWFYEDIEKTFGEIDYYVNHKVKWPLIVPDDDISGTFLFYRALEDNGYPTDISARTIGDTWLNYIIEDRTVLWWGGLGRSTEHTAYLRLKSGIEAPQSGSIAHNGVGMAEQIGAEIFIDAWAMVNPGDPERAAAMARAAGSVSHDGVAVEAACLLAAMQAAAYTERDIDTLLDLGLRHSRSDALNGVISDVRDQCANAGDDWRAVRRWLGAHHGYERYPGNCPMVPNHALLIASLLLGGDDVQKGLKIAVSSGWDTDCNAGNLGALNGIRLGLDGLSQGPDFRGPVADLMYIVGADGGECVTDAVIETRRVLRTAAALAGKSHKAPTSRFAFEFPGSVQGFQRCPLHEGFQAITKVGNLNETGPENGLDITYHALAPGVTGTISVPTFIDPKPRGVSDTSYFEVIASPSLYGTQTVRATVRGFGSDNPRFRFFIQYFDEAEQLARIDGNPFVIAKGDNELVWPVPDTGGRPIHRLGIELSSEKRLSGRVGLIDLDWSGAPDNLEFGTARELTPALTPWDVTTFWTKSFVSSAKHYATDIYNTFTLSHPDAEGVITTGTRDWTDYTVSSELALELHDAVGLVARARGHKRYYAGIVRDGEVQIIKRRDRTETVLARAPFAFQANARKRFALSVKGETIALAIDGHALLNATDAEYLSGGAGFFIEGGTVPALGFAVRRIKE
ncbi:ADP-ribosylglycohydrolase family protein [Pelagibacterium halotolerans]|uniref:Large exoproteins involved in heme utilization or adhesion n=1 Tax=Pelagibacterium halotolerans (strain DSM 22347 / JCM 15775 / CGMCC 1.7692 / B2) TaxID=1082931 RepID=G4REL8_PELHB|nr:ADP-ribosylglycohydrolase family protein [Pelagibacterium halotolerans]AEQ50868.1 large exoproteins involved in heme utilization or adhesion [Pelagibacterium halotolerans B2]QJR19222.1 ADP-ribosylglycohydrolase family protein [Pelagibacterium halotolerans]SDZ98445.1 ADP-ribosylglycohydrolase [Pelagibacterium halotolerans]